MNARWVVVIIGVAMLLSHTVSAANSIYGLYVKGNAIYNQDNQKMKFLGVDRSGTEFACIQGWGIFDGPSNLSSVEAIKAWNVNIVRVPMNEDCWLGINGVKSQYSGANYQNAIKDFVDLLNSQGMAVILDLHWTAPGSQPATGQQPMADTDHSITFWQQVAAAYASNSAVLFDAFNEPYPDNNNWNSQEAWTCWRDGGSSCTGVSFNAAGMQSLVNAIRGTGAKNIITLGGIAYSNSLAQWLEYKPTDPTGNLAASWHSYNFNFCSNETCWNNYVKPVADKVPVLATEFGENDCQDKYVTPLMNWMDSAGLAGYLGWTWDNWDCDSGPALITDWQGNPTGFGAGVKSHYLSQNI